MISVLIKDPELPFSNLTENFFSSVIYCCSYIKVGIQMNAKKNNYEMWKDFQITGIIQFTCRPLFSVKASYS